MTRIGDMRTLFGSSVARRDPSYGASRAPASVSHGTILADTPGGTYAEVVLDQSIDDSGARGKSIHVWIETPVKAGQRVSVTTEGGRYTAVSLGTVSELAGMAAGAVVDSYEEYALGDSRVDPPSGGWSREPPPASSEGVVWRRSVTVAGDGTVTRSSPVPLTGEPGTTIAIECDGGTVIRNGGGSTVLRAVVMSGGSECRTAAQVRSLFGEAASVSWSELGASGWEDVPDGDPRVSEDGMAVAVSGGEVDGQATFMARLSV